MPSSCGGGSHSGGSSSGGGSFSGGGSHGGGSGSLGGSSRRSSYKPFAGAYHHCYYDRSGRMHEYYYSSHESMGPSFAFTVFMCIFLSVFPLAAAGTFLSSIAFPKPLAKTTAGAAAGTSANPAPGAAAGSSANQTAGAAADSMVMLEDNADIFTEAEEKDIRTELQKFYDKTGIIPYAETEFNSEWETNYISLENYAYEQYVSRFSDEKHFLVLYTQPAQITRDFTDWHWWAVKGDDTAKMITPSHFARFQKTFQDALYKTGKSTDGDSSTIAAAYKKAFAEAADYMLKPSLTAGSMNVNDEAVDLNTAAGMRTYLMFTGIFGLVFVLAPVLGIILTIRSHLKRREEDIYLRNNPEKAPEKLKNVYAICPCCNAPNPQMKTICPYCGMPLTKDTSG